MTPGPFERMVRVDFHVVHRPFLNHAGQLLYFFESDKLRFPYGLDYDRLSRHVNHFYDEVRKNPKRSCRELVPTGFLPEEIRSGKWENVPWSIRLSHAKRSDALAGIGSRTLFDADGKYVRHDYLASDVPNSLHSGGINVACASGASVWLGASMNENQTQERVTGIAGN